MGCSNDPLGNKLGDKTCHIGESSEYPAIDAIQELEKQVLGLHDRLLGSVWKSAQFGNYFISANE